MTDTDYRNLSTIYWRKRNLFLALTTHSHKGFYQLIEEWGQHFSFRRNVVLFNILIAWDVAPLNSYEQ